MMKLADGSKQSVLVPQVYVRVQPGDLDGTGALLVGRDVQLNLSAAQNINLATVTTANSQDINWSGMNYLRQSASQDVGSQISAAGKLTLSAGQDINAKAASINAGQALNVNAGNNVNITTGQSSQSLDTANRVISKGTLSSRTLSTRQTSQSTTAVASNLEGSSVSISAGQDLRIQGANVLADQDLSLNAGRNVNIVAAQNTQSQRDWIQTGRHED